MCHGKHAEVREQLIGKLVLSFYHVDLRAPAQDALLGGVKYLYPPSHLTSPDLTDSWHITIAHFCGVHCDMSGQVFNVK